MRIGCCVLLFLFLSSSAFALDVLPTNAKHTLLVRQLVETKIKPILSELSEAEQLRIKDVKIAVVRDLTKSGIAISLEGAAPRIFVSDQFLQGLNAYAEAYSVGLHLNQPHFTEAYFHHFFWHTHPDFSGLSAIPPSAFAAVETLSLNRLENRTEKLFESALMDILLHELGHHAEKAFYTAYASYFAKQEMENKADRWAERIKSQFFPSLDPLGRLLSIAFIFERDRWSTLSGDIYYPRMLTWVADSADPICENAQSQHVRRFCQRLNTNISVYFSSQAEQAYRLRVDNGEQFAAFPLAQILLRKRSFHDACQYFKASEESGNIKRASVYVAWCYLNRFFEHNPPDAKVLALTKFRDAKKYGYTDAQRYIEHLNQSHSQ